MLYAIATTTLIIGWIGFVLLYLQAKQRENTLSKEISSLKEQLNKHSSRAFKAENEILTLTLAIAKQKMDNEIAKEKAVREAVEKSRSVMRGQATEHLAPLLMEGFNPKDFRFVGNPIDFLVIDGLSDLIDKQTKELPTIYLIDIKTGKASLTTEQRKIRDAIKHGKIKFGIFNPDQQEFKTFEPSRMDSAPEGRVEEPASEQLSFRFPPTYARE